MTEYLYAFNFLYELCYLTDCVVLFLSVIHNSSTDVINGSQQ